MSRENIPAGQEGYYGPRTVAAVNKFKNKYLPGGNTGVNEGKFGDTTWLYLKREVKLKNLEGIAKNQYYATELGEVWNTFYSDYDKLVAKTSSSSSISGNTYNYGKSNSSNQGTSSSDRTKITVYLPEYMNKVIEDMGVETAIEIYIIQLSNDGIISNEDAKRIGLDFYGVGLLEVQYRLNSVGMNLIAFDYEQRQKNYQAAINLLTISALNATIANANSLLKANGNNSQKVSEPNGGVKYPKNNPTQEGTSKLKYKLKPQDLDWRGSGKSYKDALEEAFNRTGVPKDQFEVTKWGKDINGKSIPVEWKSKNGAEVNIDWPHDGFM